MRDRLEPGETETEALIVYDIPSRPRTRLSHPKQRKWIRCNLWRIVAHPPPYNCHVARGWESKSVELQQEDASLTKEPKRDFTPEQRRIESRKQGLKLSRSRILEQIRSAENLRYRKTLEQALAELDEQIMRVSWG